MDGGSLSTFDDFLELGRGKDGDVYGMPNEEADSILCFHLEIGYAFGDDEGRHGWSDGEALPLPRETEERKREGD